MIQLKNLKKKIYRANPIKRQIYFKKQKNPVEDQIKLLSMIQLKSLKKEFLKAKIIKHQIFNKKQKNRVVDLKRNLPHRLNKKLLALKKISSPFS